MGCNQSSERKQETTQVAAEPQPQVEAKPETVVEVAAKHEDTTATDVIVASPVRVTPASPSKIEASHADLEPSLDHVAAEGPSEVPSQMETPREQADETIVEPPAEAVDIVVVTETVAVVEAPVETSAPVESAPAESVQTEAAAVEAAPAVEAVSVEIVPAAAIAESKEEVRSPVAVPLLAIPAAAPQAKKAVTRSKTPVRTTTATSKTPSKSPAKQVQAQSKTPDEKAAARKVQFDKVPAQNPQEQRKLRARKAAGRNQSNVNEEMFLASVAAFERQLTHRGTIDKQLGTR